MHCQYYPMGPWVYYRWRLGSLGNLSLLKGFFFIFFYFFIFVLLSSSVFFSCFILAVPMSKCLENCSSMSFTFPAAKLNGTCLFGKANIQVQFGQKLRQSEAISKIILKILNIRPQCSYKITLYSNITNMFRRLLYMIKKQVDTKYVFNMNTEFVFSRWFPKIIIKKVVSQFDLILIGKARPTKGVFRLKKKSSTIQYGYCHRK